MTGVSGQAEQHLQPIPVGVPGLRHQLMSIPGQPFALVGMV